MKNKLVKFIMVFVLLNFIGAYLKAQKHSKASEKYECKNLAVLDKRCQDIDTVASAPPQVYNKMNEFAKSY